jgi:hypothetical protein
MTIYAASLMLGVTIIAITIAINGGTRNIYYGTSLANQIAAVQTLARYSPDSTVEMRIPQWKSFPLSWRVLFELTPLPAQLRPARHLIVRYRDAGPGDARIEVDESSSS